jgi:hypothetical protein
VFEARTLLFLAAFAEFGGDARHYPLHLVCIGEPPHSVRRLAEQAGAMVEIVAPSPTGPHGMANKMRGLEVARTHTHCLLLDADVLILGDPSGLSALAPGLAAAPAILPRLPKRYWRKIYAGLQLELPAARIASAAGAVRRAPLRVPRFAEQNAEAAAMLPYYNGGILYWPGDCQLARLWPELVGKIRQLFDPADPLWESIGESDQAGLAVALQILQGQGVPFWQMSPDYHGFWLHLYRQSVPSGQIKLFHAFDIFRGIGSVAEMQVFINRYRTQLLLTMLNEWAREWVYRPSLTTFGNLLVPAICAAHRLGSRLSYIYNSQVRPALRTAH